MERLAFNGAAGTVRCGRDGQTPSRRPPARVRDAGVARSPRRSTSWALLCDEALVVDRHGGFDRQPGARTVDGIVSRRCNRPAIVGPAVARFRGNGPATWGRP
jgi:hypothetical protein